jgi:hypothetical protein
VRYTLKVNISYAVTLEDIPLEVGKLLQGTGYSMTQLLNDIEDLGTSNPMKAVNEIAKVREGLKDLDLRLADCYNILSGYVDLQNKIASGENPLEVEDEPAI